MEVIYRKRQDIGLPCIIHVKRILFNQMIKERTFVMTGAEEVSFFLKWDHIGQELLMSMYLFRVIVSEVRLRTFTTSTILSVLQLN